MALTFEDLRVTLRSDLDDPQLPGENDDDIPEDQDSLWSDAELENYLRRAERQLSRRLFLIHDVMSITLVADQADYTMPEYFLKHYRAYNDTTKSPIKILNMNEMDEDVADDDYGLQSVERWRTMTGPSKILILEEKTYKITVAPIPTSEEADQVIKIHYARMPKTADGCLEIKQPPYEDALLMWAKKLAYDKEDVDVKDGEKALKFEAEFNFEVSRLKSEMRQRIRHAGVVRYGGIP